MNQTEDIFDHIFKSNLENATSQVPPGVWEGISSSVGQGGAMAGAAVKTAVWMKAAIAVVAISAAGIGTYLALDSKNNQEIKTESVKPVVTESQEEAPMTEMTETDKQNTAQSEVQKIVSGSSNQSAKKTINKIGEEGYEFDMNKSNRVPDFSKYSIDANLNYQPDLRKYDSMSNVQSSDKDSEAEQLVEENQAALEKQKPEYNFIKDSSYIFIPNAVTPDGDGYNDVYQIKLVGEESYEIIIYSIDNQILFRSKNKYQAWNCKLPNGEDAPEGNYLVKVIYKFKGKEEQTEIRKLTLIK